MPASTSQRRTKPKVRRNSDVIDVCDPDPICDLQITSDFQRLILAVLTRTPETGVELSEAETTLPDLSLSS